MDTSQPVNDRYAEECEVAYSDRGYLWKEGREMGPRKDDTGSIIYFPNVLVLFLKNHTCEAKVAKC